MTNMKYNKNINTLVEIFFERIAEIKPAHNPPMPYNISENQIVQTKVLKHYKHILVMIC